AWPKCHRPSILSRIYHEKTRGTHDTMRVRQEVAAMSTPVASIWKKTFPVWRVTWFLVRPCVSAQFWKSLAFLLLGLPLGFVYFTMFVVLLLGGIGTIPIGIGLLLLVCVPPLILFGARVERRRVGFLLGGSIPAPDGTELPSRQALLQKLR